jgi:hypothetical protein
MGRSVLTIPVVARVLTLVPSADVLPAVPFVAAQGRPLHITSSLELIVVLLKLLQLIVCRQQLPAELCHFGGFLVLGFHTWLMRTACILGILVRYYLRRTCHHSPFLPEYPVQKVTEIYKKVTKAYKKVTELVNSSWNVLSLLRSEVQYIGTGHPTLKTFLRFNYQSFEGVEAPEGCENVA